MSLEDFRKLHRIYSMYSPGSEQAALVLGPDKTSDLFSRLQDCLINANDGIRTVKELKEELENIYKATKPPSQADAMQFAKQDTLSTETRYHLNRYVSFYSSLGGLQIEGDLSPQSAYMWSSDNRTKSGGKVEFHQIVGLKSDDPRVTKKPMSIVLSRTPFVSPATKDASQVVTFLNYIPSVVMSRCMPYLSIDFVLKRPLVDDESLSTMGIYKFLLGGKPVKELGSSDVAAYRAKSLIAPPAAESNDFGNIYTSAGMEMFTAPQTLLNLREDKNDFRYIKVMDPTRPFATIESFNIEIKATTGLMSFKTAQLVLTLHDKTRLSEIADLIQPSVYGRSTLWITYGWRHPIDNSPQSNNLYEVETYQEFINERMLIKESYGISNVNFSFDLSGQVKITLSLYTKSVEQMRKFTLTEDMPFMRLRREQERLSRQINEIKQKYKIEAPKGVNKEIRPYVVLNSAASGLTEPSLKPEEVFQAIKGLGDVIKNSGLPGETSAQKTTRETDAAQLVQKLNIFYFGSPAPQTTKEFNFSAKAKECASEFIKSKFDELNGPDPFLPFQKIDNVSKVETMLLEYGYPMGRHPYISEMSNANLSSVAAEDPETQALVTGLKSKVVSFGKLFSVFVLPMIYELEDVDECQVFFYNINNLAGLASGTNLAEFPIDLPEFLRQYNKQIASNGSINITVENFVKLVVSSQLNDLRAIPFGFRSGQRDYFEKWTTEKPESALSSKGEAQYAARAMAVNLRRGAFTLPKIEVYVETPRARTGSASSRDLLNSFGDEGIFDQKTNDSNVKNIMRIHVYDAAASAYTTEVDNFKAVAERTGKNTFKHRVKFVEFNPYLSEVPPEINPENLANEKDIKPEYNGTSQGIVLTGGDPNSRDVLIREMSKKMPVLTPGMNNSSIFEVNVTTNNDQQMSTIQMLRTENEGKADSGPRGDGLPGLPLRIIPVTLEMKMLGCPHVNFSQQFYVDMNTGTDIDNSYAITSINHAITPAGFETSIKMAPVDAYPQYAQAYQDLFKKEDEAKKAKNDSTISS